MKKYLETSDNVKTMTQNLWDTAKAVLRGKFIAIQPYIQKQDETKEVHTKTKMAKTKDRES